MRKLLIQENRISYGALFARPAFGLWGDGSRILDGLFTAFSKRGINLGNFRFDQTGQDPAAQGITVSFGPSCSYKFKLDRVESTLNNFRREDYAIYPEILQEGATWLRSTIPGFSFQSHLFTYFGHSRLSEGTSQDVLAGIPTLSIPEIGESEGNGIIFHWKQPESGWRVQLLVDHSLNVTNGVFIQFLLFVTSDSIDYPATASAGRGMMDVALKRIGLEMDYAN